MPQFSYDEVVELLPFLNRSIPPLEDRGMVEGLIDFCNENIRKTMTVLETGTLWGVSAFIFSLYARHVFTIDMATGKEVEMTLGRVMNVSFVKGDTFLVAESLHTLALFDIVYIDTIHGEDFLSREIEAWLPHVRPGGIMSGHDYCERFNGVRRAVDARFGKPEKIYSDSTWMVRVPG